MPHGVYTILGGAIHIVYDHIYDHRLDHHQTGKNKNKAEEAAKQGSTFL
jgi:hypothetical protein